MYDSIDDFIKASNIRTSHYLPNGNINWKGYVIPRVIKYLNTVFTYKTSVRGMGYYCYGEGLFPNTQNNYKTLDSNLIWAKKNGFIALDAFADGSRRIIDIDDIYWSPNDYTYNFLNRIGSLHKWYHSKIPPWHKQDKYSEFWLEKDAIKGVVESVLTGRLVPNVLDIRIVPNKGWTSEWSTFQHENTQRLKRKLDEGIEVHVFYLGDYDPTGLRMTVKLKEALEKIGVKFERIGITDKQISHLRLVHFKNPDPKVLAKLEKDSNTPWFRKKHDGQVFQIEVDSLQKDPKYFKNLILRSAEKHFDKDVYRHVLSEHSEKYIYELVTTKIQEFLNNRGEYVV